MSTVESIAAKYGHEMQNDAFGEKASDLIGLASKKALAQKAVDNLFAASKKASFAIAEYNKALSKSGRDSKMVDYHDVLNNLKTGANTRI